MGLAPSNKEIVEGHDEKAADPLLVLAGAAMAALMVLLVVATALEKADAEAVAGGSSSASVPELAWQPCPDPAQSGFECATAQVPLDYGDDPQGSTIDLAVIRHQASDPTKRIGALFFNPGGPGGSGTELLPAWIELFPAEVRERFDIVSWDPRGIGASTAVQCFATAEAEQSFFAGIPFGLFPVGNAQKRAWIQRYARFGKLCGRRNGDLLAHVSTADSARDMDLLRQAVGEPQLNYLGVSYGTLLGATYATLFPNKVRAMVLDGNVDPVAWTNEGKERTTFLSTSLRLGSDKASAKTLNAFLTLCGGASTNQCAFSAGSAGATRAKWATLLRRLRQQPVTIAGQRITYAALVASMSAWLTTTEPVGDFRGWTSAAQVLQKVWQKSGSGAAMAPADPAASGLSAKLGVLRSVGHGGTFEGCSLIQLRLGYLGATQGGSAQVGSG